VLQGWDNFYFLIGSAAAGLIGLLFVVVTLTSGIERSQALRGASLYMTPTAVHFAVVLSVSAVAVAPRLAISTIAAVVGVAALVGLANALRASIGIGAPKPPLPPPHWSDFWLYGAAPTAIYLALIAAAAGLWAGVGWAVQATAALLLTLLLLGIRNAWDLVTYMAPQGRGDAG
jgi:hypothetical protein